MLYFICLLIALTVYCVFFYFYDKRISKGIEASFDEWEKKNSLN